MKLQKKSSTKQKFKHEDLFKENEEDAEEKEESVNEEENAENAENRPSSNPHKLNWVTASNLYNSAILVKEINCAI